MHLLLDVKETALKEVRGNFNLNIRSASLDGHKGCGYSNYLDSQISCSSSPGKNHHWRPSPARKAGFGQVQPMAVRRLKQQLREKKKLIIEGRDSELKGQSSSMVVANNKVSSQPAVRFRTILSQKKSKAVDSTPQAHSLTRKAMGCQRMKEQEKDEKEEKRSELITSILKRYKTHLEEQGNPEDCSTPTISSVKLNDRYKDDARNKETIKFFPRRGCPPGKITQDHHEKKEKKRRLNPQSSFPSADSPKEGFLSPQKPKEPTVQIPKKLQKPQRQYVLPTSQISPWQTQEKP